MADSRKDWLLLGVSIAGKEARNVSFDFVSSATGIVLKFEYLTISYIQQGENQPKNNTIRKLKRHPTIQQAPWRSHFLCTERDKKTDENNNGKPVYRKKDPANES